MTDELKQEYTRRISQANPTELTVIIYDIALAYINDAENMMDTQILMGGDGKENGRSSALMWKVTGNIRRCLNELIASLHYEHELAVDLRNLYVYCLKQLGKVNLEGDKQALKEVKGIIERLRSAYGQVAHLNGAGAVMANSQSVYAGLTYGRGTLNEDIVGTSNRGFLA